MIPAISSETAVTDIIAHFRLRRTLAKEIGGRRGLRVLIFSQRMEAALAVGQRVATAIEKPFFQMDVSKLAIAPIGEEEPRLSLAISLAGRLDYLIFIALAGLTQAPVASQTRKGTLSQNISLGFIINEIEKTENLILLWAPRFVDSALARRMHSVIHI